MDGAVVECDVGVGSFVCGFKKTLFADASGQSETSQADADDAACKFRQLALLLWILLYQVLIRGNRADMVYSKCRLKRMNGLSRNFTGLDRLRKRYLQFCRCFCHQR